MHEFAESVSLCVGISSKLPLRDSRIGDNVKRRGWEFGLGSEWCYPRLEGKIFFSMSLRGPTQTNETIH
jgi:hypothetical protein